MILPPIIHTLTRDELESRAADGRLRGIFRVDHDDYHRGPGISSTKVKAYAKSPAHAKAQADQADESDALRFGRALHMALLEPEVYAARYVIHDGERRGKAYDALCDEADKAGREILTAKEAVTLDGIVARAGASEIWRGIVRGAEFEIAAYARHPESGILCKAKADLFSESDVIFDWKSCASSDPTKFSYAIADFGYHTSAAFYMDVFEWALGSRPRAFLWGAAEKSAPFGIRYYRATDEMLRIGRAEYERGLRAFGDCQASGEFPCYPDEIADIELPFHILKRYAQ